jgi:hypothetical protein
MHEEEGASQACPPGQVHLAPCGDTCVAFEFAGQLVHGTDSAPEGAKRLHALGGTYM